MARRLLVLILLAFPLSAADTPQRPADLAGPSADAVRVASGLATRELAPGTGTMKPDSNSLLVLRFTVWKSDGTLVQHVPAPQTVQLSVSKMIEGWGEAVQQMLVGAKQRAWVPADLTSGKSALAMVIDTELVAIRERPVTPPDVAAPPADATTTKSGMAYRVLRPGTGIIHPNRNSRVVVDYSGWTTDGRLFDSSVLKGQAAEFGLQEVIRGWTEGVRLMVTGEKTRFWIPASLAYANQKGMPMGMLVFDIELIAIK